MISINNHGGVSVKGTWGSYFVFYVSYLEGENEGNSVLLICKSSLCRCASASIIAVNLFSHVSTILLVFELPSDKVNLTKQKIKFDSCVDYF